MSYLSPLRRPRIYAYADTRYPNCLKVGYTTRTVTERLKEQYPVALPSQSYRVELDEEAIREDGSFFTDHEVHQVLLKHGVERLDGEWFKCDLKAVQAALLEVKTGVVQKRQAIFNFGMRPEQQSAVEKAVDYFQNFANDPLNQDKIPHFLWNAKMRFGKTFAAYQLAKRMGWKKVLVLTFKPAVQNAWQEDLQNHLDFQDWAFVTEEKDWQMNANFPQVCFGSFQDYLGKSKAGGIKLKNEWVHAINWDCVVFDERLSPSEVAKLSFQIGTKVIDKTVLILDIFAQRAKSREGKLQVELAQLEYQLPRLSGQGIALSRQGGGIGTRGPGETQLETDKRHIYRRINFLKKSLKDIEKMREVQSQNRKKKDVFLFSLVGYTNAGKSSLLNLLTNENIYVADQLFATLDSTTRRLPFFQKREVLLSDTVGFIRNLPPELVDAFKSTLMELEQADVILHLVDLAQEGYEKRIEVVDQMIKTLGLAEKKQVYILNKVDLLDEIPPLPSNLLGEDCCYISVASNIGIEELKRKLEGYLENTKKYDLCVPYQMNPQKIISELYSYGKVKNIIYEDYGANLQFESKQDMPKQYLKFIDE